MSAFAEAESPPGGGPHGQRPGDPGDKERSRRTAVRKVASGVTVLTVALGDQAHGSTASAVTAVSAEPLLICACLRRGSTFADLAVRSSRFVVNVLSGGQGAIADWFADPRRPPGYRQFAAVDWSPDPSFAAPLLRGAIAWLDCRLVRGYPGGDHSILLAEVLGGASGTGNPLLSFDRGLHSTDLLRVSRRSREGASGPEIITLD